jgi:tetratricopeptide (TPR) repeat protein
LKPPGPVPDPIGEATTLVRPGPLPPVEPEEDTLAPGQMVADRYTVLELLGQGGMGRVLAAYDARLDRRVALKLLRYKAAGTGSDSGQGSSPLIREAQAMARLSHPHVVAVYDSGTLEDGRLFIAMEYVQGQTLRQWQAGQRRSWREVLQAYLAAGRGLAAAHGAGLIHRDFKPDNVLVGEDGRVRVTDFGLARSKLAPSAMASQQELPQGSLAAFTLAGAIIGTPAYMALEQLQGRAADVRTDVFSFCASLYEALHGRLPFPGTSVEELTQAQLDAKVAPPEAASEVPAWVSRTVLQGLHADPTQRPVSMEAVLAALEADPEARRAARHRLFALASVMVALSGLAVWGWARQQGPGCAGLEAQLAGVWDQPTKSRVRQALAGTGLSYAQDTADRVVVTLDAYASQWVKQRVEVCEAPALSQGARLGSLALLQEACLERRRSQLRALTELLARGPDKALLAKAAEAAQALPPLSDCMDAQALTAAVPPPEEPALRVRVEALEKQLDRLEALHTAGKYQEGLTLAEQLRPQVEPVGHAPLSARALLLIARLRASTGDYAQAESLARQAIVLGARGRDVRVVVDGWGLVSRVVYFQGRGQEVLLLVPVLEAVAELSGDDEVRARALNEQSIALHSANKLHEATQKDELALALWQKVRGADHPDVASALQRLGTDLVMLGQYEEAGRLLERALEIQRKVLGPEHPQTAAVLLRMALLRGAQARYEEQLALSEEALAILRKASGAENPQVVWHSATVGHVLQQLGRYEEAQQRYEYTLAWQEKALGRDSPLLIGLRSELGTVLADRGRYEEAARLQQQALAHREGREEEEEPSEPRLHSNLGRTLLELGRHELAQKHCEWGLLWAEKSLGTEHPDLAPFLNALGAVLTARGRYEQARALHERALSLQQKVLGPDSPTLAASLLGTGESLLEEGRAAEAIVPLERAVKLAPPRVWAQARFSLARALWAAGQERERAVALAGEARERWRQWGHAPKLEEANRWLASRPSGAQSSTSVLNPP